MCVSAQWAHDMTRRIVKNQSSHWPQRTRCDDGMNDSENVLWHGPCTRCVYSVHLEAIGKNGSKSNLLWPVIKKICMKLVRRAVELVCSMPDYNTQTLTLLFCSLLWNEFPFWHNDIYMQIEKWSSYYRPRAHKNKKCDRMKEEWKERKKERKKNHQINM